VSKRVVLVVANDKVVSLGQYVRAIKQAKAHPTARFDQGLSCWWPCTGEDIMKQFMDGVHERINDGIPYIDRGRKQ
jgi:hypothetical protein